MAAALGVTVQDLIAGPEAGRPTTRPVPPAPIVAPRADRPGLPGLTIPVVRCGCPGACPFTAEVSPATAAVSTLVLPAGMLSQHREHRLLATPVGEGLAAAEWPVGTQLVVDTDARTPTWEALALIHTEGRCQLGHLTQVETALLFGVQRDGDFRIIMDGWRILGTVVAAVVPL